jgi:peptidoglycan/LPS O-acetylase OafA/YrhL
MGVSRPHVPPAETSESRRLHHFDGVRGWAAFTVVVFHSTTELFGGIVPFLATGWLGLFNDGLQAVHIFFVLSGFVLSNQFFAAGHLARIRFTALGRYARLTIPIAAASFLTFILMKSGFLLNHDAAVIVHREDWLGWFYQFPASLASYLRFVFYATYFDFDSHAAYDVVLWTMPYELIGSFLIFAMVTLFGPNRQARLMSIAAAVVLFWKLNPMYLTFLYGYLIADLNSTIAGSVIAKSRLGNVIGLVLLAVATVISVEWRNQGPGAPIYAFAGACVVLAPVFSAWLRSLLSCAISRWLGRVSFPLYLTHMAVICTFASFGIIALDGMSWPPAAIAAAVVPPTIVIALMLAQAFEPVERFAILCSHRLAALVMRPETSPHGARRGAPATRSLDQSGGSEPFRSYDASRPSTRAPARSQS